MKISFCTTTCTLGLLLLTGCSQAPAPAPAAPDTRAADEKTIRDGEAAWNQDWAAKDVDKIVSHYADEASLLIPDQPLLKGKADMKKALQGMISDSGLTLSFMPATAEVSKGGDLAYTQGAYTMTMTDPKTKKLITEKGKYVTVYRKQADGSWKAVEDINNADSPAAPGK